MNAVLLPVMAEKGKYIKAPLGLQENLYYGQ